MRIPPALLALGLAACAHVPRPDTAQAQSPSAAREIVLEFPAPGKGPVTLQEFVQTCQKASGWNFTYTLETDQALRAKSLQVSGVKRVASADFPGYVETLLASNGFECKPIGPERVHVLLISTSKS
jgi:hypothetical protein